jgi:hypothetical protein
VETSIQHQIRRLRKPPYRADIDQNRPLPVPGERLG